MPNHIGNGAVKLAPFYLPPYTTTSILPQPITAHTESRASSWAVLNRDMLRFEAKPPVSHMEEKLWVTYNFSTVWLTDRFESPRADEILH